VPVGPPPGETGRAKRQDLREREKIEKKDKEAEKDNSAKKERNTTKILRTLWKRNKEERVEKNLKHP